MDIAHSSRIKFALQVSFFLSDQFMGEFDLLVVGAIDLVPDEAVYVFTANLYFIVDFIHRLLATACLFLTIINNFSQLFQLFSFQKLNIHEVYKSSQVL
jgi:hypothetical protein